jgi:hypothetical protein
MSLAGWQVGKVTVPVADDKILILILWLVLTPAPILFYFFILRMQRGYLNYLN